MKQGVFTKYIIAHINFYMNLNICIYEDQTIWLDLILLLKDWKVGLQYNSYCIFK